MFYPGKNAYIQKRIPLFTLSLYTTVSLLIKGGSKMKK